MESFGISTYDDMENLLSPRGFESLVESFGISTRYATASTHETQNKFESLVESFGISTPLSFPLGMVKKGVRKLSGKLRD
ncbi:hypothetical protein D478_25098 [Brevibacillus agri BAB-2500]|nr:hypothetical protein D478_25098 [Brevibacillus agri BAB-2500]